MIGLSNESQQQAKPENLSQLLLDVELIKLYKKWDRQAQTFWEDLAQEYLQKNQETN